MYRFFLFLSFFYSIISTLHAEPSLDVNLYQANDQSFYGDLKLQQGTDQVSQTLKAGISIRFNWEIRIEKVNPYWWNSEFATLHISRQVIPDLVSRGWTLVDQANGISRRVFDIESAIHFLISFDHVPIVDQSLLQQDKRYHLLVTLRSHEGASIQDVDSWFYTPKTLAFTELKLR